MKSFKLEITTPERVFYNGLCESLIVPIYDGMYGIEAGHEKVILALETGRIEIKIPNSNDKIYGAISNGILKIEDDAVYILCDTVEKPEEIDEIRAREKIEKLEEELKHKQNMKDYYIAEMDLKRAINRIKVKRKR